MSNRDAYLPRVGADHAAKIISGLLSHDGENNHEEPIMVMRQKFEYIETLSYELSRIARYSDQRLLGYLLMLAAEEARCSQMRLSGQEH
jgi:hypothetical protein